MKITVRLLAVAVLLSGSLLTLARGADASLSQCSLFPNTPTYSSGSITAIGYVVCSQPYTVRSLTVRIRERRGGFPDRTVASSSSSFQDGFEQLNPRDSSCNNAGYTVRYFSEIILVELGNEKKAQSGELRINVYC